MITTNQGTETASLMNHFLGKGLKHRMSFPNSRSFVYATPTGLDEVASKDMIILGMYEREFRACAAPGLEKIHSP